MTAKTDILQKIHEGFDNSRKLCLETGYAQEYVRRVANQLYAGGDIDIIREPRGNIYRIREDA